MYRGRDPLVGPGPSRVFASRFAAPSSRPQGTKVLTYRGGHEERTVLRGNRTGGPGGPGLPGPVLRAGKQVDSPSRSSLFRDRLLGDDLRGGRLRDPGVAPRAFAPVPRDAPPVAPPGAPRVPPRVSGRRCPDRDPGRHRRGRRDHDRDPDRRHHRPDRGPGHPRRRVSLFSRPWLLLPMVFFRHLTLPTGAGAQSSSRSPPPGRWAGFRPAGERERPGRGRDGRDKRRQEAV